MRAARPLIPIVPIHSHQLPSIPISSHPLPSVPIHSHQLPSLKKRMAKFAHYYIKYNIDFAPHEWEKRQEHLRALFDMQPCMCLLHQSKPTAQQSHGRTLRASLPGMVNPSNLSSMYRPPLASTSIPSMAVTSARLLIKAKLPASLTACPQAPPQSSESAGRA